MAGLRDYLPTADALVALEPEDLGIILLELVQQVREPRVSLSNIEMPLWNANSPDYPHHRREAVCRAIAEAWQWLLNEGLLMIDPEQPNGWFCLTRKGTKLKTKTDVEAYRQGAVLPVSLLHTRLREKILPMFTRGDYDVAVFQAFKEVEVAVRKHTKSPDDLVGVKLMREAFQPERGPLTDMETVSGERVAVMELYAGAMGHCKNPPSHRDITIHRISAAQLICFASYLLIQAEVMAAMKEVD